MRIAVLFLVGEFEKQVKKGGWEIPCSLFHGDPQLEKYYFLAVHR